MCTFNADRCWGCLHYPDCLDETQPVTVSIEPRTDAPLKVIVPWCRTKRDRRRYAHAAVSH